MFPRAVLWPFVWTRLCLALVAWFSAQVGPSWSYPVPEAARRGWAFVPAAWIDAFARWDAHWYLDVAVHGYSVRGPLANVQSNVAFFPLYPWAVRVVHALLPGSGEGSWLAAALLVSNGAALAGLWLLFRLARQVADEETAGRTVLYALLFPTGFVLSAPYPESTFLLLSVASLSAALSGRAWLGGALGLLLALTRPAGVLVALPLAWIALSRGGRRLPALAASALPGLGLLLHAGNLWRLTGDPLALFHAQSAWDRALAAPWRTLLHPRAWHPFLGPFEAAATALVVATGAWLASRKATRALGVWGLASAAPVLLSGTFVSAARFAGVAFPAFLALGLVGRRPEVDRALTVLFAFAQAVLFLLWTRFFWVV